MTQFTLKELEHIRDNIGKSSMSHKVGTIRDYQKVRDKAQAMIDNFNAHPHDWVKVTPGEKIDVEPYYVCVICGKVDEENPL